MPDRLARAITRLVPHRTAPSPPCPPAQSALETSSTTRPYQRRTAVTHSMAATWASRRTNVRRPSQPQQSAAARVGDPKSVSAGRIDFSPRLRWNLSYPCRACASAWQEPGRPWANQPSWHGWRQKTIGSHYAKSRLPSRVKCRPAPAFPAGHPYVPGHAFGATSFHFVSRPL